MRKYPICAILGASFLLGSFSIALAEMVMKQQAASTEHQQRSAGRFFRTLDATPITRFQHVLQFRFQ